MDPWVVRDHDVVSFGTSDRERVLFHVDTKIGSFDDFGRPRGTAATTTAMVAATAATTTTTTTTATTTTTTTTTTTATTTAAATATSTTTTTTTTWMTLSSTPATIGRPPSWTRREAARDRRLVLLGAHVHQHHLLLGDLAVLDVDRLRGVVEAGRSQDDQRRAKHAGQREDPEEDPVEHHRDVLPVLLHLGTTRAP